MILSMVGLLTHCHKIAGFEESYQVSGKAPIVEFFTMARVVDGKEAAVVSAYENERLGKADEGSFYQELDQLKPFKRGEYLKVYPLNRRFSVRLPPGLWIAYLRSDKGGFPDWRLIWVNGHVEDDFSDDPGGRIQHPPYGRSPR